MSHPAHSIDTHETADEEDVVSPATTLVASPRKSSSSSFTAPWDKARDRAELRDLEQNGRASRDEEGPSYRKNDLKDDDSVMSEERQPLVARPPSPGDAIDGEEAPPPLPVVEKEKPVSWMDLPKKGQLTILTLARLSEPLAQTSLQSYMFYQLKSFKLPDGSSPSDETVARQAGILAAAFTGAQFMTAIMWGRLSDWQGMGRKRVILVGLLGTAIGALGFGFSQSFPVAVFWRCVAGLLNGNIGVMRTMISEIIR